MRVDTKEFELPDTTYVRDIDSQVFKTIVLECLSKVQGVRLAGGGLIESLLGLENLESLKSIIIEQDEKMHAVNIKIDLSIAYGLAIPAKAEEVQAKVTLEITKLTGLHVGTVHVVVKNIYFDERDKKNLSQKIKSKKNESEYNDEF
jgi:uncharacterized alkaline shock family protein YloU